MNYNGKLISRTGSVVFKNGEARAIVDRNPRCHFVEIIGSDIIDAAHLTVVTSTKSSTVVAKVNLATSSFTMGRRMYKVPEDVDVLRQHLNTSAEFNTACDAIGYILYHDYYTHYTRGLTSLAYDVETLMGGFNSAGVYKSPYTGTAPSFINAQRGAVVSVATRIVDLQIEVKEPLEHEWCNGCLYGDQYTQPVPWAEEGLDVLTVATEVFKMTPRGFAECIVQGKFDTGEDFHFDISTKAHDIILGATFVKPENIHSWCKEHANYMLVLPLINQLLYQTERKAFF